MVEQQKKTADDPNDSLDDIRIEADADPDEGEEGGASMRERPQP